MTKWNNTDRHYYDIIYYLGKHSITYSIAVDTIGPLIFKIPCGSIYSSFAHQNFILEFTF